MSVRSRIFLFSLLISCGFGGKGQKTYTQVEDWFKAMRTGPWDERMAAFNAFRFKMEDSGVVVAKLLQGLRDSDQLIVRYTAYVLGEYRLAASKSIPLMDSLIRQADENTAPSICLAIAQYGEEAVPGLRAILREFPPPYQRDTGCYFKISMPAFYAAFALSEIGPAGIDKAHIATSLRNYDRNPEYFITNHVFGNMSSSDQAEFYGVTTQFNELSDLFAVNPGREDIKRYFERLQTSLSGIPMLKDAAYDVVNNQLPLPIAVQTMSAFIDANPKYSLTDLIENLSLPILFNDSILFRISGFLQSAPDPENYAGKLRDKLVYRYGLPSDNNFERIPVSGRTMNNFGRLLGSSHQKSPDTTIYLVTQLTPAPGETTSADSPIVKALLRIVRQPAGNLSGAAYRALAHYIDLPEVKQVFVEGYQSADPDIATICIPYKDKLSIPDSAILPRVLMGLKERPVSPDYGVTTAEELLIANINKAAQLDPSHANELIPLLTDILRSPVYNGKDAGHYFEIMNNAIAALAKLGLAGKEAGAAFLNSDNPLLRNAIINNLILYIRPPSDNHLISALLKDANLQEGYFFRPDTLFNCFSRSNYPVLPALLELLNKSRPYDRPTYIFNGIRSIGDTVIPMLKERYAQNNFADSLLGILLSFSWTEHPDLKDVFEHALRNGSSVEKYSALVYLSTHPALAGSYLPELQANLDDSDARLVSATLKVMGRAGAAARPLLKHIFQKVIDHAPLSLQDNVAIDGEFAIVNISIGDTSVLVQPKSSRFGEGYDVYSDIVSSGLKSPRLPADTFVISCLLYLAEGDVTASIYAYRLIGLLDTATPAVTETLVKGLYSLSPLIRQASAQAIVNLGIPPQQYGQLLNKELFEEQLAEHWGNALHSLRSLYSKGCAGAAPGEEILPPLAWPPPPASTRDVVPVSLLAGQKTLGDVYNKIVVSLHKCNYDEVKLFGVNDGFAILTKMERIDKSGTPSSKNRWTRQKLLPLNLTEYFKYLLLGSEGNFRVMLFVVTPLSSFKDNGVPMLTADRSDAIYRSGGSILPATVSAEPFAGKFVHILIYQFYKKNGGDVNINYDVGEVVPALTQLNVTNIIKYLSY